MSAAFFDVDDTILKGSSGVMLARYMMLDRGVMTSPAYILDLVKAYIDSKTGAIEYDKLIEKGLGQFSGRSKAEIEDIAKGLFDNYMRKNIYRLAYREIQMHKERGNHVVLLTASLEPLIQPLAEFLGVDYTYALRIKFENGVMIPEAERPFSYEEGKLILARQYVQEHGFDLADCYFYSDSSSDLPLMEAVGHPMPTCPDPNLKRIARMRNWTIRKFVTVLPSDFRPEHWKGLE
jgi:HAD superfamily hydrolase (TIGR01490 family)